MSGPRFLLGGNLFGYATDFTATRRLLDRAEDLGVTAVDTADVYSDGASETYIGSALAGRRNRWFIASKAGVRSDGDGRGIASRTRLRAKLEQTLRRLQTEHLDLYQLHRPDDATPITETVAALEELRCDGMIRAWGVSNFSGRWLARFRTQSVVMPATNQIHCNVLSQGWLDELSAADRLHPTPVLAYGVLGRGVLSGRYENLADMAVDSRAARSERVRADLTPEVLFTVAQLSAVARDHGVSLPQLAVAAVLNLTGVTGVVVGVRTPAQLTELAPATHLNLGASCWQQVDGIVANAHLPDHVTLGAPVGMATAA